MKSVERNSKVNKIQVFTDGGSRGNPGPAAAAAIAKDPAGKVRLLRGKYLGRATNNFAEYQGVIPAFEELLKTIGIEPRKTKLAFNLDSSLVVNQLNGTFKVKNPKIRDLVVKVKNLEPQFLEVSYVHIPREKNTEADRIVNETLDKELT